MRPSRSSNGEWRFRRSKPLTRRDWPQALQELARQLDDGRIYDRDLAGLSVALDAVLEAYNRRPYVRLRAADDYRATWGRRHTPR